MENKTRPFVLILALITLSLLVACAGTGGAGEDARPKQLSLAVVSGVEGEALKQAAHDYEAETSIHVQITEFPYGDLFAKEIVDLTDQTGAYDLVMLDDPWFPQFATANLLADITPLYQKRNKGGPDDDFVPASLDLCKHPYQTGALYALPYVGNSQLFFYR